jgi:glutamate racemase
MIEEGFFDNTISESVIHTYLSDKHLKRIKALILGCTHYPLIKNQILHYYQNRVEVIDSSEIVAAYVKQFLHKNQLLNTVEKPYKKFFVSDYTRSFELQPSYFLANE